MDTPPPRWVRRLFITPIVFVVAAGFALASPLIHLLAALLDLVFDRRRWRLSRFVGLGLAFCVVEVFGLFTLLTVWIGSGFGRYMSRPFWTRANSVLAGQYLELITRALRFFLGFRFTYSYEPIPPGPQLVFCRHAGPGDAFLIARVLIRDAGRHLHMVGAAKLQWDPFLDIAGERLGYHYLRQTPSETGTEMEKIQALAAAMADHESLAIFPEGGNFTPGRKARQLDRFRASGRTALLAQAEALKHTLLPRVGGTQAALQGAPHAVVLIIAHAGLDGLHGFGDLWAAVPLDRTVTAHSWSVAGLPPPISRDGAAQWLSEHWQRLDEWIGDHLDSGHGLPPA